jgi:hypothetical protein
MLMAFKALYGLLQQLLLSNLDSSGAAADAGSSDGSGGGSSGDALQPKWGYLLQLQQNSRLAEAAAVFNSSWPDVSGTVQTIADVFESSSSSAGSSSATPVDVGQLYADALQLCRALVLLHHCRWCATTLAVTTWKEPVRQQWPARCVLAAAAATAVQPARLLTGGGTGRAARPWRQEGWRAAEYNSSAAVDCP